MHRHESYRRGYDVENCLFVKSLKKIRKSAETQLCLQEFIIEL